MHFIEKYNVGGTISTSDPIEDWEHMRCVSYLTAPRHSVTWVVLMSHDVCWYSNPYNNCSLYMA